MTATINQAPCLARTASGVCRQSYVTLAYRASMALLLALVGMVGLDGKCVATNKQKWNGVTPNVMGGSGGGMLFNIPLQPAKP